MAHEGKIHKWIFCNLQGTLRHGVAMSQFLQMYNAFNSRIYLYSALCSNMLSVRPPATTSLRRFKQNLFKSLLLIFVLEPLLLSSGNNISLTKHIIYTLKALQSNSHYIYFMQFRKIVCPQRTKCWFCHFAARSNEGEQKKKKKITCLIDIVLWFCFYCFHWISTDSTATIELIVHILAIIFNARQFFVTAENY